MIRRKKEERQQHIQSERLIDDAISTKFASKTVKVIEFADDGRSGTNFDRPGVTKLLELAKQGKVNCIIVKDSLPLGQRLYRSQRLS